MQPPGPRYAALLQLLRTAEGLWESSRLFFAEWDLSPSQFNVLNLLRDQPEGMRQVELSRDLIMHRSNVTGLVDRLELRGLVKRAADPGDRRVHRVKLTAAGKALLKRVLPRYHEAAESVLGHLSPDKAERLAGDLERISRNAGDVTGGRSKHNRR